MFENIRESMFNLEIFSRLSMGKNKYKLVKYTLEYFIFENILIYYDIIENGYELILINDLYQITILYFILDTNFEVINKKETFIKELIIEINTEKLINRFREYMLCMMD